MYNSMYVYKQNYRAHLMDSVNFASFALLECIQKYVYIAHIIYAVHVHIYKWDTKCYFSSSAHAVHTHGILPCVDDVTYILPLLFTCQDTENMHSHKKGENTGKIL